MRVPRPLSRSLCIALVLGAFGGSLALDVQAELAPQSMPDGRYYAKGRVLVQTRAGLSDVEVDKALKGHFGKRRGRIAKLGVHIVELPEQANEMAVVKALRSNPQFEAVELDYAYEPELIVNDTYFGNAWHLPKMGVPSAWDYASGAGPTIAILDSGVNGTHPDLAAQMVPGWNFYSNNGDTTDVYGHGTKVAGAAAAAGNNAAGVVGVSWRSKIMPIRVTDTAGYGYSSAIASGIRWAADNGARVANLSFRSVAGDAIVINAANYMRSKGGVVVAAGGNTGGQLALVASTAITAVAATNSADTRTSWSSWGNHIDAAAPGEGIWVTTMSGGYGSSSGTSFASPVTAGVYALMMTVNPTLTPAQLDEALFSTARDINALGFDVYTGHGRIDAVAAVQKAMGGTPKDTQSPTVSITAPTGGSVNGTVAVSVAAADNVGVKRVDLLVNGQVVLSDAIAPFAFSWNTTALSNGSRQLQAKAYDAAGNVGSSATVTVSVANDKTAPTVALTNPAADSAVKGTVTVTANASDNVAVSRVDLLVDGVVKGSDSSAPFAIAWNSTTASNGAHTLQARAYDAAGNFATSASRSITVSNDKTAPTVSITSPTTGSFVARTVTVQVSASDDKAVVSLKLSIDGVQVASAANAASLSHRWNVPWGGGTTSAVLVAEAADAAGNTSKHSITVRR